MATRPHPLVLALLLGATTLLAGTVAQGAEDQPSLSHDGQLGLRAGLAFPFKMLFRYSDSPSCGLNTEGQLKTVCAFGAPPELDLGISYALLDSIEPFAWARLGLGEQSEILTESVQLFGAGLRIYTQPDGALKLFFEAAGGLSLEGSSVPAGQSPFNYATEVLIHLGFGGQYDFTRNIGAFVTAGPNVGINRGINLQVEMVAGVQVRTF